MELPCPRCQKPVQVEPIEVLGRPLHFAHLCAECGVLEDEERRARATMLHVERDERILRQLDALGVNVPLHGLRRLDEILALIGDQRVTDSVECFVVDVLHSGRWEPVRGLILEGPTGVGKSWLAVGIIRELLESGKLERDDIRYDRSRTVWGLIKSGYGDGSATRELEARMKARLWVLDDLGTEHATEDTGANLTEILSARELRPTVITANLPRDAHGERFDAASWARIRSRLGDLNFRVVRVTGPDHRLHRPGMLMPRAEAAD